MKKHALSLLLATSAAVVAGCTETVNTYGQVILPSRLAQVQIGTSSKDDVQQLLGSPSMQGTMNDNRWYYVTTTAANKPLEPNIVKSRKVLVLDFDPTTGLLSNMEEKTESDGKTVDPDGKTTRTEGQSMGFFEQLLGNLGMGAQ